MEENKPIRVVIYYDGKKHDSYEEKFSDQFLINAHSAAQKIFSLYRKELNAAGAYIYMDANDKRPESYSVEGISKEMWHNILSNFGN